MTSLADVYEEGGASGVRNRRRLQVGFWLLAAGTALAAIAIVVATTRIGGGPETYGTRRTAGVLGGLAAPAILGGVATVLPASVRLRAASAIGASIAVLGVAMFWHAYPSHWAGHGNELTPYVTGVYFLGVLTLSCCLFAGIATFKRRNDPGGTVSLQIGPGETKIVEVDRSSLGGLGGVGMFGVQPDGEVETQTNRVDEGRSSSGTLGTTASDGGATNDDISSPPSPSAPSNTTSASSASSQSGGSSASRSAGTPSATSGSSSAGSDGGSNATDRYCGNCTHFEYVRDGGGMQPYCSFHGEPMDDMEACKEWTPNR